MFGFGIACLAAVGALFSGVGYRMHLLDLNPAVTLLRWAAISGGVGAVLCFLGLFRSLPRGRRRGLTPAIVGLVAGTLIFWFPYSLYRTAKSVPPIHDISTDLEQPPAFDKIIALRGPDANTHVYGGAAIAQQQRAAYPDIKTLRVNADAVEVFDAALKVTADLGWELVDAVPAAGRIEATDTTLWFGFKDDVVIRITSTGTATLIDVRSVSRVGQSDLGANADRIRSFLASLIQRITSSSNG